MDAQLYVRRSKFVKARYMFATSGNMANNNSNLYIT